MIEVLGALAGGIVLLALFSAAFALLAATVLVVALVVRHTQRSHSRNSAGQWLSRAVEQ